MPLLTPAIRATSSILARANPDFAENRLGGIENLVGALVGATLPAGLAGGGEFGGVCGHLTCSIK